MLNYYYYYCWAQFFLHVSLHAPLAAAIPAWCTDTLAQYQKHSPLLLLLPLSRGTNPIYDYVTLKLEAAVAAQKTHNGPERDTVKIKREKTHQSDISFCLSSLPVRPSFRPFVHRLLHFLFSRRSLLTIAYKYIYMCLFRHFGSASSSSLRPVPRLQP